MQRTFLITYQNKGKGKLQTPAITPKGIQIPNWKKQRIESLIHPSYYHMPRSTINITSADTSTSTKTLLVRITFQSKQKKNELLGAYNFGTVSSWKITESEEKKNKNQKFNYQKPIPENLNIQTQQHLENPEIKTPNIQIPPNQKNQKPDLIHQQNLPPVIIIDQPPIEPIGEPIQPPQVPFQQPLPLQQLQQQLPQQPQQSIVPIAYAPIIKLEKFTGKEDDVQAWLNDIAKAITANNWNDNRALQAILYFFQDTVDSWYQSLATKPQMFDTFKQEFLRYFSNNNSINHLVNTFTIIKQGDTEAITTYLGQFHRCLHQIQAINTDYFTVAQILNQFIRGLYSSIFQHIRSLHPADLQAAITNARDFEAAELEANHTQAVNLVMNRSSELDSKLKQFSNSINQKLERTQRPRMTQQSWRLVMVVHQLIPSFSQQPSGLRQWNLGTGQFQNPNSQNYLSLLITPKDASANNSVFTQKQPLISNIPPATITENESLAAIFSFKFEETTAMPLFNKAVLEAKPITVMYTNAKVEGQFIKLILDSGLAGSIITQQLMDQLDCRVDRAASARIIIADRVTKTPIGKINNFPFEVNGIVTSIKVLVMEATQYQALIGTPVNISRPTHMCTGHMWPLQNSFEKETIDQTGEGERKTYLKNLPRKEERRKTYLEAKPKSMKRRQLKQTNH
ncbi:hypothetical protein G9A89_011935 [Geosiphon pyriformis]|nr:hypothetical protein G9A89_011935 [Geosiphon pyriformis]